MKSHVETNLVYHINELLGIVPDEIFDHLDLSIV